MPKTPFFAAEPQPIALGPPTLAALSDVLSLPAKVSERLLREGL